MPHGTSLEFQWLLNIRYVFVIIDHSYSSSDLTPSNYQLFPIVETNYWIESQYWTDYTICSRLLSVTNSLKTSFPMRLKRCNNNKLNACIAELTMLKNKPHNITTHGRSMVHYALLKPIYTNHCHLKLLQASSRIFLYVIWQKLRMHLFSFFVLF